MDETGTNSISPLLVGLKKPGLVLVAGRPGVGKTAFLLNLLREHCLLKQGSALVYSIEMSRNSFLRRLACLHAGLPPDFFELRERAPDELQQLREVDKEIEDSRIQCEDFEGLTIEALCNHARNQKGLFGQLDDIFVDYVQLIGTQKRASSRQEHMIEILVQLEALAKELGVLIIAVTQVSRAPEFRDNPRPRPEDIAYLPDLVGLEQIFLLYRELRQNGDLSSQMEITRLKNKLSEQETWLGRFSKTHHQIQGLVKINS